MYMTGSGETIHGAVVANDPQQGISYRYLYLSPPVGSEHIKAVKQAVGGEFLESNEKDGWSKFRLPSNVVAPPAEIITQADKFMEKGGIPLRIVEGDAPPYNPTTTNYEGYIRRQRAQLEEEANLRRAA